jgi:hypothetical protein
VAQTSISYPSLPLRCVCLEGTTVKNETQYAPINLSAFVLIAGGAGALGQTVVPAFVAAGALMCHYQFIRNQSELFEGGFGIVDEFLGYDVKYEL